MEFKIKIELGNDAMMTPGDVIGALRRVEAQLGAGADGGKVFDINGNSVGSWTLGNPVVKEDLEAYGQGARY